jgi:hypothetical protein
MVVLLQDEGILVPAFPSIENLTQDEQKGGQQNGGYLSAILLTGGTKLVCECRKINLVEY